MIKIYLGCYVSSRSPSDVGSTATNCSCTLLVISYQGRRRRSGRCGYGRTIILPKMVLAGPRF